MSTNTTSYLSKAIERSSQRSAASSFSSLSSSSLSTAEQATSRALIERV